MKSAESHIHCIRKRGHVGVGNLGEKRGTVGERRGFGERDRAAQLYNHPCTATPRTQGHTYLQAHPCSQAGRREARNGHESRIAGMKQAPSATQQSYEKTRENEVQERNVPEAAIKTIRQRRKKGEGFKQKQFKHHVRHTLTHTYTQTLRRRTRRGTVNTQNREESTEGGKGWW